MLYPHSEPRAAAWLSVGDGYEVYFEDGGNPAGIPVVFLHGGPGSGCKPSHRQFFDPERYRSLLIDQRGAGRSRPYGGTDHNSLPALIADLEKLRAHCGIDRWLLFGGSWGGALALAYAEQYPERVLGMVLRGCFLARRRDLAWFLHDGASRLLPRAWQEFEACVGISAPTVEVLHAAVFGGDAARAAQVARAWSKWSTAVVMFALDAPESEPELPLAETLAKTRIELHYALHRYFLAENELLDQAHRLPAVPVRIIHGQRDLTCTADAAWALHRAIPESQLEILRGAGHLSGEPAMSDALVRAADMMADALASP